MLTIADINELIGVEESFHASYKLMETLEDREKIEKLFENFLEKEQNLSFDWFTEYFQAEHSDRKGKKQDFTPDGIVSLASGVLGHTASNADFCAGTGGLTIKRWAENPEAEFYCEEFSDRAMPFLLFNLAIRNMNAAVAHGDSLSREFKQIYVLTPGERFSTISTTNELTSKRYASVIMNPPYSLPWNPKKEYLDQDRFKDYEVLSPKSKADFAFLLTGVDRLSENGVMSIILPHGVLFRGAAEGKIRQRLIELNLLDAVIGLPEKTFMNTDIPTAILILKKNRERRDIYFVDASKEYTKHAKQNVIESQHIEKILDAVKDRRTIDKFSRAVSIEELKENDFNLNIPRYIDTFEPEPIKPLSEIVRELTEIDAQIEHNNQEIAVMLADLRTEDPETQRDLNDMTSYFQRHAKKIRGEQMTLL